MRELGVWRRTVQYDGIRKDGSVAYEKFGASRLKKAMLYHKKMVRVGEQSQVFCTAPQLVVRCKKLLKAAG